MVVGDGRAFVAALVTLDAEALSPTQLARARPARHAGGRATDDPEVLAARPGRGRRRQRHRVVGRVDPALRVLPVDLTEESGHLTPTLKLKRQVVMTDFAADVEALYARRT